jgi:ADP-ribosylation factor-binding protein GGA
LQSAHPKIQKMCEEESDDTDAVVKLLEINDYINHVLERYKLIRKGDLEAAAKVPRGGSAATGAGNQTSLIDLEGPGDILGSAPDQHQQSGKAVAGKSLEDDLLGLSFEDKSFGQGGGISLGFGNNSSMSLRTMSALHYER